MALLNQPTQVYAQLPKLFETLRQGQAPEKFNRQFLKDIGFKSSNHHAFIPLLKGLGFLTADGTPTDRYKEFLDKTKWRKILGQAVKEAYSDVFVLKAKPTKNDRDLVAGKFKSTYNLSELVADRNARTFLALLDLSDFGETSDNSKIAETTEPAKSSTPETPKDDGLAEAAELNPAHPATSSVSPSLHYNIQIHLPATKDIEVYNSIFKSIREHLID